MDSEFRKDNAAAACIEEGHRDVKEDKKTTHSSPEKGQEEPNPPPTQPIQIPWPLRYPKCHVWDDKMSAHIHPNLITRTNRCISKSGLSIRKGMMGES